MSVQHWFECQDRLPVIIQGYQSKRVLTMTWEEKKDCAALLAREKKCLGRQERWPFEPLEPGNLAVREVYLDCDGDALLAKVEPPEDVSWAFLPRQKITLQDVMVEELITWSALPGNLLPVVVEDTKWNVLMMAWMNREALHVTYQTRRACYYSRSRKKLWRKGEESGHVQTVQHFWAHEQGYALLIMVEQTGGACHDGYRSCFYRRAGESGLEVVEERIFDPKKVYKAKGDRDGFVI